MKFKKIKHVVKIENNQRLNHPGQPMIGLGTRGPCLIRSLKFKWSLSPKLVDLTPCRSKATFVIVTCCQDSGAALQAPRDKRLS